MTTELYDGSPRGSPTVPSQRALIDAALDCIVIMDASGRIADLNAAAERTFGYSRARAVGHTVAELLLPESQRAAHRAGLERHLATGETRMLGRRVEAEALCADGRLLPVELSLSRLEEPDGPRFVAFLRDLSERNASRLTLTTRQRLAELTGALGLAMTRPGSAREILQRCTDLIVEHLSAAFARIWTLNPEEQVLELRASSGLYTHLNGPHGRVPVGRFKIGQIAATREAHLTNSVVGDPLVSDQDWAKRTGMVSFAGVPLMIEDELVGVLATFSRRPMGDAELQAMSTIASNLALLISRQRGIDALRRRALELARTAAALERSNRELSEFAYITSHDLKAPLRGIGNLAQWIEEDLGGEMPGDVQEHLQLLRGRVHRMEGLIDGILQYSRVGRLDQSVEMVDTGALVTEIVDLLELPETTRVVAEPTLPAIETPRLPLLQVLMNLITNAVRHSRRTDALVRVSARAVDGGHEFSVADNGPGVPPEFRDRIWGVFQRLEARDAVEGTGIGLAIVRKIVEGVGGTVGVGEGHDDTPGARFWFIWPARGPQQV